LGVNISRVPRPPRCRSATGKGGAVRTALKRIAKLEHRFGTVDGPRLLLVVCKAGWGLPLDLETCVQILEDCGALPTSSVGVVNLLDIPEGLSARQTETFLRENGAALKARTA
jgi:hypothetical protein